MKNLFILPTPNPSRLQLQMDGTYHIENGQSIALRSYQNIYIISDEKTKEKDWCLHQLQHEYNLTRAYEDNALLHYKIILTTDQDLIKDGVQAIDDNFLNWFVKNPSCEEVDVVKNIIIDTLPIKNLFEYKIIIPKEELNPTTQVVREAMRIVSKEVRPPKVVREGLVKEELNLNCFDCNKSLQDCTCMEDTINMKQETLEEFIEREGYPEGHTQDIWETGVRDGAAWQQERLYSYDELRKVAYNAFCLGQLNEPTENKFNLWIQQFKKK
jgi:hypothetical protein